jgi:hypothetical protein
MRKEKIFYTAEIPGGISFLFHLRGKAFPPEERQISLQHVAKPLAAME